MENDKITKAVETTEVKETEAKSPEAADKAVPEKESAASAADSLTAACESAEAAPAPETDTAVVSTPSPDEVNAANAALSTGKVQDDGQGASFFTAADVRAMSREQVRRNLAKILKSMESPDF